MRPYPYLTPEILDRLAERAVRRTEQQMDVQLEGKLWETLRDNLTEAIRQDLPPLLDIVERYFREADDRLDYLERRQAAALVATKEMVSELLSGHFRDVLEVVQRTEKGCMLARPEAAEQYPQWMSIQPNPLGASLRGSADAPDAPSSETQVTVLPAPERFIKRLRGIAEKGETVVLVDPYAFANVDDASDKAAGKELFALFEKLKFRHLVVCCKPGKDSYSESQVGVFRKGLTAWQTLEVMHGDFHDRFLLAGRGNSMESFFDVKDKWRKQRYWRGVVFGTSLNGIAKRPTYVLPLPVDDVFDVIKYLDSASRPVAS